MSFEEYQNLTRGSSVYCRAPNILTASGLAAYPFFLFNTKFHEDIEKVVLIQNCLRLATTQTEKVQCYLTYR